MRISILPHLTMFAAVLTGLVVPFLFFGRAVMAAPLLAAILIVAVWLPKRGDYWRQMIRMARTPVGLLLLMMLALWVPSIFFSPLAGQPAGKTRIRGRAQPAPALSAVS